MSIALSENPNKALEETLQIIDSLQIVLEEEYQAAQSNNVRVFTILQERKIEAARRYQNAIEQIMRRKAEFETADPALKEQVKAKQAEFRALTQRNISSLELLRKSFERLSNRIMKAVQDSVQPKNTKYSAAGHIEKSNRSVSISINESA